MFNPTWAFVGAVYAAAVVLARRRAIDLPVRVAVFFYVLVLAFMYLPMTQDYVNVQVDFLRTLPPWQNVTARHDVVNQQLNDVPLQIVPWAHQVRESWKALEVPLWNHLSGAGYPLLASFQSSALSPLRLIGLPLSLGHAMTFEAGMKILIALTFMFLWCRKRGASEIAAVIGAVGFGLSTFMLVWLHFPLITTACFVPAVFYIVDLIVEKRTYARFVAAAAVWALMLFGGHPETVSHTFFMAALYVAWIIFVERAAGATLLLRLAGALAVAGLLAAPLLIPFAETVTKSKRYMELQLSPRSTEVPFSDWASVKLLFQPEYYGEIPAEIGGPAHAESVSGYAGYFAVAGWFAMLAHVVRRRAWRSRELFFVLATLVALGIVMSWPGVSDLFHLFFQLAANARMRLFIVLFLAVQSALVVDLLLRDRLSVLIGVACGSGLLLFLLATSDFPLRWSHDSLVLAMVPAICILLITAACAMASRRAGEKVHYFAVLLLLVAVCSELWSVGHEWNADIPDRWMYPRTPMLEELDRLTADVEKHSPFRIVANGATLFPNTSAVYGYEDVRAHDPMVNGRYIRLLALVTGYEAGAYFGIWKEWEKHFIDYLNVRYVVTTPGGELPPRFALRYDGKDGRIFENTAVLPRFFPVRNVIIEFNDEKFDRHLAAMEDWRETALLDELELETEAQRPDFFMPRPADAPLATAEIITAKPTDYRLHVKAPRWSLVASSVPWWPGWRVERNGAPVQPIRVNGGFLGFAVPPGEVDVRVWYDPWSFRIGAILSLVTIAVLVGIAVRPRGGLPAQES